MNYGIAFTPLVPALVLWLAVAAIVVIAGLLLLGRARGAAMRVTALGLIVLALANPSFTREDREPLSSVAAVVIDKSPSQNFGERIRETEKEGENWVAAPKKSRDWKCGWSKQGKPTAKPMARNYSARCRRRCRTFPSIASPVPS